jgi:hypothetical protein
MIQNAVFLSLAQYEPRINVRQVDIVVSPDQFSYTMTIFYNQINSLAVQKVTLILQRNR